MNGLEVSGSIEPGFEGVRDAFIDNFEHRGDTGAACAVYADGRAVVDIWAGAGSKGPWTAQTRSIVFSVSKGITTICLLMAAEQTLQTAIAIRDKVVAAYQEIARMAI